MRLRPIWHPRHPRPVGPARHISRRPPWRWPPLARNRGLFRACHGHVPRVSNELAAGPHLLRDAGAGPLSRKNRAATTAGFSRFRVQASGIFRVRRRGQPWHGGCSAPYIVDSCSVVGCCRQQSRRQRTSWPRSRLSLMVAGHVPQGSARPSACLVFALTLCFPSAARASLLSPELEDKVATFIALVRHLRRPGRAHRPVLDGAHPAGEDRAQAPPSAVRGHPHAVPAVAGVRRAAVAVGLAVGVHEAGRLQAGLRHRQASRHFKEHGRPSRTRRRTRRRCATGWRASKSAASRPPSCEALRADLDALEAQFAATDEVG